MLKDARHQQPGQELRVIIHALTPYPSDVSAGSFSESEGQTELVKTD